MVLVMVNPGRRIRDRVNQRDAVGGDLVEVRDVERKILIHRGYVSDPPADTPTPEEAPAAPAPVAAPETPIESTPESTPARSKEELAAEFQASLATVPDWKDGDAPAASTPKSTLREAWPAAEREEGAQPEEEQTEAQLDDSKPPRRRRRRDTTAEEG